MVSNEKETGLQQNIMLKCDIELSFSYYYDKAMSHQAPSPPRMSSAAP